MLGIGVLHGPLPLPGIDRAYSMIARSDRVAPDSEG